MKQRAVPKAGWESQCLHDHCIHYFDPFLLSIYYKPGAVLGAEGTTAIANKAFPTQTTEKKKSIKFMNDIDVRRCQCHREK